MARKPHFSHPGESEGSPPRVSRLPGSGRALDALAQMSLGPAQPKYSLRWSEISLVRRLLKDSKNMSDNEITTCFAQSCHSALQTWSFSTTCGQTTRGA